MVVCHFILLSSCIHQQPKVYNTENKGKKIEKTVLPDLDELMVVEGLTNPFEWSNGSGRSTSFSNWSKRRNEIAAEIQHYEIGSKPGRFGFSIVAGHPHCQLPGVQQLVVGAFLDKFLLDNDTVNTIVSIHPLPGADYKNGPIGGMMKQNKIPE